MVYYGLLNILLIEYLMVYDYIYNRFINYKLDQFSPYQIFIDLYVNGIICGNLLYS